MKAKKVHRAFNDQNFKRKEKQAAAEWKSKMWYVAGDGRPWYAVAPRVGLTALATARLAGK